MPRPPDFSLELAWALAWLTLALVGLIVLGLPVNMDGTEGPRCQSTRSFARNFAKLSPVPVVFWDERLSTAAVERMLIQADASRAILDGWDDLRRRLQPDRRCFAFFHPQLPDEPLIFVEVALVPEMAGAIAPLIDKRAQPLAPEQFKVAVFYSISNCQPGLRGVSLGNFLIKRVAERLKTEFGVYILRSGRMCVAGLNTRNVEATAEAMAAVLGG